MRMKPWELFAMLKNTPHEAYTEAGDNVNYRVVTFDDERIVRLIFEQSHGKRDWQNNFTFPCKPYKNQVGTLWIASGWADAYKSCNDEIMTALIDEWKKHFGYDVEICGWSYGGAMSMIAAEDFNFRTDKECSLVTFGAPKALWGEATRRTIELCCSNFEQYANVNDVVTMMPPFPGYTTIGNIAVGKKKCFGIFDPNTYHTNYDEKENYEGVPIADC